MPKFKKGNKFGFSPGNWAYRSNKSPSYSQEKKLNLRSRTIVNSSAGGWKSLPNENNTVMVTRSKSQTQYTSEAVSGNIKNNRDTKRNPKTSAVWKRESLSNRSLNIRKNAMMWNTCFEEHRNFKPNCHGFLHWDMSAEEIRGLGCREKMICSNCKYKSKMFSLYEEVETGKRGRKAGKQNIGLAIGLSKTPIAAASFRRLCLSSNMPAPSASSIQHMSNKVLPKIEEINRGDMKQRCLNLIEKQQASGKDNPNALNVQGDALYNNNFYSGVGKTPFQPATQVIYTVAENVTENNDVIGMLVHNKLCNKGKHLKSKKSRRGHKCCRNECFATIPFKKNIGDERTWVTEALTNLKKDSNVEVEYLTTDPSTSAFLGAKDLFDDNVTKTRPIHQLDTAHVSRNHRKFIKKHKDLAEIIKGETSDEIKKNKNNLALDIAERCQAEMKRVSKLHPGDIPTIKNKISYVVDAIVKCYQNSHTLCKKHSFVCKGWKNKNWLKKSTFLGKDFSLNKTESTSDTLRTFVNYRLGPEMLDKTKFSFSTQKVEAFNRALRTSLPKNITFSRNVSGRAHSVCHSVNQGKGNSITNLCNQLGSSICPNSKVHTSLKQLQRGETLLHSLKKLKQTKKARITKRRKLYKLHHKHEEEVKKQKDVVLPPQIIPEMQYHNYDETAAPKRVKPRK